MPVSATRHAASTGATFALAIAGLIAPASLAHAAPGVPTSDPSSPVAGTAFKVTVPTVGTEKFRVVLTSTTPADTTDQAEENSCSSLTAGTSGTLACTLKETKGGSYTLRVISEGGTISSQSPITVLTPITLTDATLPRATDHAGFDNDLVTVHHVDGVTWTVDGTPVNFKTDAGAPDKIVTPQKVPVRSAKDIVVSAAATAGYVIPGGNPSYTFRFFDTAPTPVTVTAPTASDKIGKNDDTITLTAEPRVDWYIGDTKVDFGAATVITVPSKVGKDVQVKAIAKAGQAFAGSVTESVYTLTFTDEKGDVPSSRLEGRDRMGTAVATSQKYFADGAKTVYIANGWRGADALAAGPAAKAADAPLLLVQGNHVPDAVMAELARLKPTTIKIVGGQDVISEGVASALSKVAAVDRIHGGSRYATAAQVAAERSSASTVYVALGVEKPDGNFPDALSGGWGAAAENAPMLLSQSGSLTEPTAAALKRLAPAKVVLVGDTGVLSAAVHREAQNALPGGSVIVRAAGKDRFETSALVVENVAKLVPAVKTAKTAFLATGRNYPDALAGAPVAAKVSAPLALVDRSCQPKAIKGVLEALPLESVVRLGGVNVVGDFSLKTDCGY